MFWKENISGTNGAEQEATQRRRRGVEPKSGVRFGER
jgi:hypothetical protein